MKKENKKIMPLFSALLLFSALCVTSLYNDLLFHSLAEIFSIIIACGIFMFFRNSNRFLKNNFFTIIGIAFLDVAIIDLLHTLAYKGMNVFHQTDINLPTQLWISARYFESMSFLSAVLLIDKKLNIGWLVFVYNLATLLLLSSIFIWPVFPDCFVEGAGLTLFKKTSEYAISSILIVSIAALIGKRFVFDERVLKLLIASICLTIGSELSFTIDTDVYGIFNMVGHIFKIISFYLIYKAIIETGMIKPYDLLFRELKHNEAVIRRERDRAQKYLDIAGVMLVEVDVEKKVTLINRKGCEILKYGEDEVIGKNWFEYFLPEKERTLSISLFERLILGGKKDAEYLEASVLTRTGGERIIAWRNTVLLDEEGAVVGTLASGEDITDRRREEEKIRKLSRVVEQSPASIIIADTSGNVEYVNPKYGEMTGYGFDELMGRNPEIFKSAFMSSYEFDQLWKTINSGRRWHGEFRNRRKSGEIYWESASISPVRNIHGDVTHFLAVKEDITERKMMEEALRKSEASLANAQRIAHIGNWERDIVTNELRWSEEIHRIFGLGPNKFGATFEAFLERVHPEDREYVRKAVENTIKGRGPYNIEYRIVRPDNSERTVEAQGEVTFRDGKAAKIAGTIQDITERKQAEKLLRESEERYRSFVQHFQGIAYQSDLDFNFDFFHGAAESITGYRKEELVGEGLKWDWIIHPRDISRIYENNEKMRSGKAYSSELEYRIVRKDGRTRWVKEFIQSISDISGKPFRIYGAIYDITETKLAEAKLKKAKEEAETANRAKSEFLANISHEIRTPMNSIIGMADLLGESALTEEQRGYVAMLKRGGENLMDIINDILDISKIESGQVILEESDFRLGECLLKATEIVSCRAKEKGLALSCDIAPDVPEDLTGDAIRLRQVLINILGNAIKFTERGEISLQVKKIKPENKKQCKLLFSVWDTGIGIPADKIDAIFGNFVQVDSSVTRRHGGTGLGLAISKRIVERMGGRIWVESELRKGSTFYFEIAFGRRKKAMTAERFSESELAGVKVLVVDDSDTYRQILKDGLSLRGAAVCVAANCDEGLNKLRYAKAGGKPYDLVLIDNIMPGRGGAEMIDIIGREGLKQDSMAIILVSSFGRGGLPGPEIYKNSGTASLTACLNKPARVTELIDEVADILNKKGETKPEAAGRSIVYPLNILLAEDAEDNRLLVQHFLKETSYKIDLADNGEAAFRKFVSHDYDLILMDMQMPIMDGYVATKEIRKFEKRHGRKAVPIIALTAHAFKEEIDKCIDVGCSEHLSKPVKKTTLLETIKGYTKKACLPINTN